MLKALLKKQILESFSFTTVGKGGKRRSKGQALLFSALLLAGIAVIVCLFWAMAELLCKPLHAQGQDWLYFALMGTISTALGLVGSIFAAKSKLYEAKDNDLLLSMPIPSWVILFSRLVGLYFLIVFFEALVFIPALVCYFIAVGFSAAVLIGGGLVFLAMPLGTLAICCILGWLLTLVTAKLPGKKFFTLVLSLGFFALYIVCYSQINEYLTYVVANGEMVGGKMKSFLYPFYQLGRGCVGKYGSLAIYAAIFVGAFVLTYLLLSFTYLPMVTANRGSKKRKYKGKNYRRNGVFVRLLKKEAKRYFSNPMITLNCFLGTLFALALPVIGAFNTELLNALSSMTGKSEGIAMVFVVILCACASMNVISSCSVSLEGENLWILRSSPVKTESIFLAKIAFHWLATAIPIFVAGVYFSVTLKLGAWLGATVIIACLTFVTCVSIFGLVVNLKTPKLNWPSELAAVKQNFGAMLAMFGEWALIALLVVGYFFLGKGMFIGGYLLFCAVLLALISGLLVWWLQTRGKKVFEGL